jgi:hypothetical protein
MPTTEQSLSSYPQDDLQKQLHAVSAKLASTQAELTTATLHTPAPSTAIAHHVMVMQRQHDDELEKR